MKFYRRQPIEAEQFDGSQTSLFGYEVMPDSLLDALTGEPAYYSILIDDFEPEPDDFPDDDEVSFEIGDWIVNEADEIKVMADDVFKKTYAELPVISEKLDSYIQLYKRNNYGITDMLYDLTDEVCPDANLTKDDIARAWLDGYQVEGHK
ncbi:hypothetical protein [Lactiplantibacillus plantarum]|uniref:hypothetical protein n=1 Tax=Lactiplantibacillus plantarum TaxID=1590 RepID=UPI0021035486|nr:hypothetical protein [Lactiplantibacillus plantarum]